VEEQRSLSGGAVLRRARRGDEDGILDCIRRLAEYEKEPDAVQTTADDLRQALFGFSPSVFAHVVEKGGQIVAIALTGAGSSPAKAQATAGSIEAEVSRGSRQAPPWTCTRYRGSPDGESAPGRDLTGAPMSSAVRGVSGR
jgi:hypothetical protein